MDELERQQRQVVLRDELLRLAQEYRAINRAASDCLFYLLDAIDMHYVTALPGAMRAVRRAWHREEGEYGE